MTLNVLDTDDGSGDTHYCDTKKRVHVILNE